MGAKRNFWPFEKTVTVYHRRGASTLKGGKYKSYRIWEDADGWHTSLDPGSWFDSKRDVTRFIDSWDKGRSNPTLMSGQPSRYSGFYPNPPAGWFQRCVKAVSEKGGAYDPNAVCAAQEQHNSKRKVTHYKGFEVFQTLRPGALFSSQWAADQKMLPLDGGGPFSFKGDTRQAVIDQIDDYWQQFPDKQIPAAIRKARRNILPIASLTSLPTVGKAAGEIQKRLRKNVTDRALRYRAVKARPAGLKRCNLCGNPRARVEVGHVNGREEDTTPENLFWTCRSCNVLAANAMRNAGVGRLTHQYNPAGGAKSVGQWLTAVTSMKGESDAMTVPDAVAMIHATSAAKRSEYARDIWSLRKGRGNPPPFSNLIRHYAASQVEAIEKVTAKSQDFGSTLEKEWTAGGKVMMVWSAPTGERVLVTIGRDGSYYGVKLSERGIPRMRVNQSESVIRKHMARGENLQRLLQRTKEQTERLNIKWVDARDKYGAGSPRERAANRKAIASSKLEDVINQQIYKHDLTAKTTIRNPEAESVSAFESFHGFPPREHVDIEKDEHFHEHLWAVGTLEKLTVLALDGGVVDLSGFKGALLCGNEAGTQLYVEGGDQEVDLSEFGIGEPYHDKEELGKIKKLFYFTNKTHLGDQGGEAVYHHTLGEEKTTRMQLRIKVQPTLAYDVLNKSLEFIGGEYMIEPEGIRN